MSVCDSWLIMWEIQILDRLNIIQHLQTVSCWHSSDRNRRRSACTNKASAQRDVTSLARRVLPLASYVAYAPRYRRRLQTPPTVASLALPHYVIRCCQRRQTSAPVPPSCELHEAYASYLIRTYSLHYIKIWRRSQNRKYITYHIAVRRGQPRPQVIYMQKIWWSLNVWFLRYVSGETNKQTHWW